MAQPLFKTLEEAGELIVAQMRENLKKKKIDATGTLSNSLSYAVKETSDGYKLLIEMEDYGPIVDKGRGPSTKGNQKKQTWRPKIIQWMRAKGIKPEPGVKIETAAFLITRAINRGVNSKGKKMYPPKPFIEVSINEVINEVYTDIERSTIEVVEKSLLKRK